jgi:hypothetical protein
LRWQSVDKGDPHSLRAFIAKYPANLFAHQAKKELGNVLATRQAKA